MTTPRRFSPHTSTSIRTNIHNTASFKSSNKHFLFLIKLLLILIIILLLPQLVESKSKRNKKRRKLIKQYNELKSKCGLFPSCSKDTIIMNVNNNHEVENNEMCIAKCMNIECFERVYCEERGGELEPGEVDEDREIEFENCVKDFLKKEISKF